jgi:hypothetical protein
VTTEAFRHRLAELLDEFLSAGGDPFWVNAELSLAGMQACDALRCDLIETDEAEDGFAA